jgi:hypothetical protein
MFRIDPGPIVKQGAVPHGDRLLGRGPTTIAQGGCLLCCLVMAARHVTGDPDLDVIEASRLIAEDGGFDGTKLRRRVACKALGLDVLAWEGGYVHADVVEAIQDGDPPIIGIDYKRGRSSAKSDADHFVLGLFADADNIYVADPAVGEVVAISIRDPHYRGERCHLAETMSVGRPL